MNTATKIAMAALVSASLGGCASTESMDDATQTKLEGTAIGALLGAALGAAIGGSDGVAIGAAIGAGAGFIAGNEVAKRKAKYANDEDFLNGEVQYVAEYNRTASDYNARLAKDVRELERNVASLEKKVEQGKSEKSALTAKRNDVQKKVNKSRELLADLEKEYKVNTAILDQVGGTADKSQLKKMEHEIALLQQNINALRKSTEQLAAIDSRLSV